MRSSSHKPSKKPVYFLCSLLGRLVDRTNVFLKHFQALYEKEFPYVSIFVEFDLKIFFFKKSKQFVLENRKFCELKSDLLHSSVRIN